MTAIRLLRLALLGAAAASGVRAIAERRELQRALEAEVGPLPIRTDEQLLRLHRALHTRIDPKEVDRRVRRPLLRQRAVDTWRSGVGLCGENARLAIVALDIGGVRGNRLYLRGARWDHCMAEINWHGRWIAFDGHEDEKLRMADDQVGRLSSHDISVLPNRALSNPWRRAVRFKPLLSIKAHAIDTVRPPQFVVRIAESPDAVRSIGLGLAAGILAAVDHRTS